MLLVWLRPHQVSDTSVLSFTTHTRSQHKFFKLWEGGFIWSPAFM